MRLFAQLFVSVACAFAAQAGWTAIAEAHVPMHAFLGAPTIQRVHAPRIPRTHNLKASPMRRRIGVYAQKIHEVRNFPRAHASVLRPPSATLKRIRALAPPHETIEELEIEWLAPDYVLDDPRRKISLPRITVTEAFLCEIETPPLHPIAPRELDRPSEAKEMLRLHPRLLHSGDDVVVG